MPETVRLNNELQIIEVRLFEDVSWDDAQAAVAESRRLFDLHGIGEVLVNFNEQRSVPDILDQLSFARKFPREMRFALHGNPPPVGLQDGYAAVQMADACYRSHRLGRVVNVGS